MNKLKILLSLVLIILFTGCVKEEDSMVYTGSVEADQVDLSSEVSGIIKEIFVEDGQTINIGDRVMGLNTEDYELQLELLENSKEMAILNYSDLKDGNSQNLVKQGRANVKNIEALINGSEKELSYLKKDYEDTNTLYESGASSKNELDQKKRLVDKEESKLQSLYKQRDAYSAQLDQVLEGATEEAVKSAELLVKQRELEIENLKRTVSKSNLLSPISGYVQNVNYNIGEWITPGTKAVTIIDTSHLWLKIYVPEKELHNISLNQSVMFLDDFLNTDGVKGNVSYISSKAEFTPKNVESKENKQEMVFEVMIVVQDSTGVIKPGMFLDISLAGGHNE